MKASQLLNEQLTIARAISHFTSGDVKSIA